MFVFIPAAARARHLRHHSGLVSSDCWKCGQARAKCRAKIRFETWQEAREWIDEFHESRAYGEPWMKRYRCVWCDGFHMTSRLDKRDRKRVEKARRRWLLSQSTDPEATEAASAEQDPDQVDATAAQSSP